MPLRQESEFDQLFRSQLLVLRQHIEKLPTTYSQALHTFADDIESQHNERQQSCEYVSDLVDDMSLAVKTVRFDLWASQTNGKQRRLG
jgi:hypothetical protein